MPAKSKAVRDAVALAGGLARQRAADDPEVIAAKRNLGTVILEEKIRQTVAKFGPLTEQQRARLSLLLSAPSAPQQDGASAA